MKRLSKKQIKEMEDLTTKLSSAFDDMVKAIEDYNGALEAARSFRDEHVAAIQEYIDNKSEKWQESDACSNYQNWKEEWEGVDMEEQNSDIENVSENFAGLSLEVLG